MTGTKTHSAPISQKLGVLISRPYDSDKVVEREFVQCCHCQRVWVWQPGSGKVRGWCCRCNGFTCGPNCIVGELVCVPWRQLLDNLAKGRPVDFRPVTVSVPGVVSGGVSCDG